jgi:hypothetical protein
VSADDEGFSDMNPPLDGERLGAFNAHADNRSAQVIQIDSSKHVAAITVCAAICGLSVCAAIWSAYTARDAATEARLAQYEVSKLRSDHDSLERQVKEIQ